MTNADVVDLISCYLDSIQTLPPEMQVKISNYLQSDLQQKHLLVLCRSILRELSDVADPRTKKRLLGQLLYLLAAIQDISDRRIGDMDELDDIIETHSQRLINARSKIDTSIPQSFQSNTEKVLESEMNISEHESFDLKSAEKSSLIQRTSMHELASSTEFTNAINVRNSELNYRGRERLPLRAVSTNSRAATRQPVGRWNTDVRRRKSGSSLSSSNPRSLIKHRGGADHKFSTRPALEQRQHKLGTTYARYSRAHHQRLKNHRAMSRPIHSSRNRSNPNSELPIQGHTSLRRKTAISKYMNSYKTNKVSRLSTDKRRQLRNHSRYYFQDDHYLSMKSLSEMDDDEKSGEGEAYTLLSLNAPKETRSPNWDRSYSENEVSEDMCGSESDASGSNRVYNCKTAINSKQTSRTPPSTNANGEPGAQKMYRLRKSGNNNTTPLESTNYHRSNASIVTSSSSDLSSSTKSSLAISHNTNSSQNCRVGYRNGNKLRLKSDTHQSQRSLNELSSKLDDGISFKNQCASPRRGEHTSEESVSPDERLYCICKKVSFGDMIACDNKFCEVEWFHFSCVDVRVQPKGKWYCPYCRGESSKIKRVDL